MARAEHYMKFQGEAHLQGQGHDAWGDEITAFPDARRRAHTRMELRGNSRITRPAGPGGPEDIARARHRSRLCR
jgi:hypothetical protein